MSKILATLEQFYQEDPMDPFNIYGLALEYSKTDLPKAKLFFENLLQNHPEYIATYYHAAALYCQLNEFDLAENTYKKGISIAEKLGKNHAMIELKRAFLAFQEELDE